MATAGRLPHRHCWGQATRSGQQDLLRCQGHGWGQTPHRPKPQRGQPVWSTLPPNLLKQELARMERERAISLAEGSTQVAIAAVEAEQAVLASHAPAADGHEFTAKEQEEVDMASQLKHILHRLEQAEGELQVLRSKPKRKGLFGGGVKQAKEGGLETSFSTMQSEDSDGDNHDGDDKEHHGHDREHPQRIWDRMQTGVVTFLTNGYLDTYHLLRAELMEREWERDKAGRDRAQRRGVTAFARHCADNKIDIPFETISALYEDPDNFEPIADVTLRHLARAMVEESVDTAHAACLAQCTANAEKLSGVITHGDFVKDLFPHSELLGALRTLILHV